MCQVKKKMNAPEYQMIIGLVKNKRIPAPESLCVHIVRLECSRKVQSVTCISAIVFSSPLQSRLYLD